MNVQLFNHIGVLIAVFKSKNKETMRNNLLKLEYKEQIGMIKYGKKTYTMSDIYAGK